MFPTFDWTNFLQGLVPSIQQYLPKQPATFITPLTPPKSQLTVAPSLGTPAANIATAPLGQAQGGLGSLPKGTGGKRPSGGTVGATFQTTGTNPPPNAPNAPKKTTTQSGQQPFIGETAAQANAPQPMGQSPFLGEAARAAQTPGTFGVPGFVMPTSGDGFEFSYDVDANGYAVVVSPDGYSQQISATDVNGNSFNPIAYMSQQEVAFRAAELGVTPEEYTADLQANGYTTTNDGGFVWAGGAGDILPSGDTSQTPWWQSQGFKSEKKANQYYTEKKRAERDAAKKHNPNRPGQNKKKGEGGSGVTTATSFMGTG